VTAARYGRYQLVELVARGGMGEVFRGRILGESGFEKPVAIKRVLPSRSKQAELVDRFAREARLMTSLHHPNIVDVLDFGRGDDGAHFLVLEWIDGVDLRALSEAVPGGLPLGAGWAITRDVLRALGFAHGHRIEAARDAPPAKLVHRDVSPGNILVSSLGEVKLADFGIASTAGEEDELIAGKPGFMAPEQWSGAALDGRADLFSAAVVFCWIVARRSPFPGETPLEQAASAGRGERVPLAELIPGAPPRLSDWLDRALATDLALRFADAKQMSLALDEALEGSARVGSADDLAELVRLARRDRRPAIVLGRDAAAVTRITQNLSGTGFTLELGESLAADDPGPAAGLQPDTAARPAPANPPRTRSRRLVWAAALGIGAALGATSLPWLWPEEVRPSLSGTSASATPPAPADSQDPPRVPPRDPIASAELDPPTSGAPSSGPAPRLPSTPPLPSARPSAVDSPRPAASGCKGAVVAAASHAWQIWGGPGPLEAPGRTVWPCGTYGVNAKSRLDGSMQARTVVVREEATARIDLR
jgi:eukaryotic-like serine/threonine-protein kinase